MANYKNYNFMSRQKQALNLIAKEEKEKNHWAIERENPR